MQGMVGSNENSQQPRAVTPLRHEVPDGHGHFREVWRLEVEDLARGFSGALFVSLPLLFTMEMWELASQLPGWLIGLFLALSLVFNRLAIEFAGFRDRNWQPGTDWWDALVATGIGIFASIVTLVVIGVLTSDLDLSLAARVVALETVPTGLGAAVAINQLGSADSSRHGRKLGISSDVRMLLACLLGGYLFAFNIAPTLEVRLVADQQSWLLVGGTLLLSLFATTIIVHVADFAEGGLDERKVIDTQWLETVIAYLIAFFLSAVLLLLFGRIGPSDAVSVWLPQVIALSYVTAVGGAAGRIVL